MHLLLLFCLLAKLSINIIFRNTYICLCVYVTTCQLYNYIAGNRNYSAVDTCEEMQRVQVYLKLYQSYYGLVLIYLNLVIILLFRKTYLHEVYS